MPIIARGGTDGANMVLFWPNNLPDDADQRLRDDPISLIDKLDTEGKLIHFPCDGDGGYTLAVYVREGLPPDLAAACKVDRQYPKLTVNGDGYFGGGEYMFKREDAFLRKYPHMAGKVSLPAGTYAATVYAAVAAEDLYPRWLRDRFGPAGKRMHDIHNALATLSVVMVLAAAAGLCFLPWPWQFIPFGAAAAAVTAAILVCRTAGCKAVRAAEQEFDGLYPDYVVRLEDVPAD